MPMSERAAERANPRNLLHFAVAFAFVLRRINLNPGASWGGVFDLYATFMGIVHLKIVFALNIIFQI